MSMSIFNQKNKFSGNSTQSNFFVSQPNVKNNGNVGKTVTTVHGFPIDPRFSNYKKLSTRHKKCIIDGRECLLKKIDSKTMWTLEGVPALPKNTIGSSSSSTSSSSSCCSSSSCSSSSSSSSSCSSSSLFSASHSVSKKKKKTHRTRKNASKAKK